MIRPLLLSLLLAPGLLWQPAPQDEQRASRMQKAFDTAEAATAGQQFCEAAKQYAAAAGLAAELGDTKAQSAAALNLAETLEDAAKAVPPCTGLRIGREEAYQEAILTGSPDQKAMAHNSHALFVAMTDRKAGEREIEELEAQFEAKPEASGIGPSTMAVYQYNLGRLYELDGTSKFAAAIDEYKKALRNHSAYKDAGDRVFDLLTGPARLETPVAIQGAEVATLMIEGGLTKEAAARVIDLLQLEKVYSQPDAQTLLGALLRAYLAIPFDGPAFQRGDWERLKKAAAAARPVHPQLASAIDQLGLAYFGQPGTLVHEEYRPYRNAHQAASVFSAWIKGPSSVIALATLLRRRGADAEHTGDYRTALNCYSTAWFLNPASTLSALRYAALLKVHPDLEDDGGVSEDILHLYLPTATWSGWLFEKLSDDDPARDELQLSAEDWGNVQAIYDVINAVRGKTTSLRATAIIDKSAKKAETIASRRSAEEVVQAMAGDRTVSGVVPAEVTAVYVEVHTGEAGDPKRHAIREVALATVEASTHTYSAELLNSLATGERVDVYTIRSGVKSQEPNPIKVDRRRFFSLHHVHLFVDAAGDTGDVRKPLANVAGSFGVLLEGSFRTRNHGQPYLPVRRGFLISPYAGFRLAPFSLTTRNGSLMQVGHARSFEGGVYFPLYTDIHTFFWRGYPHSVFVAPIGLVGFHASGGEDAKVFYRYGSGGGRLGLFRFARYGEKVPELISHVDVTVGKWENLGAFSANGRSVPTRLEVRGQFTIIPSALFVGFLQTAGAGPNDRRLIVGARFDISRWLTKPLRAIR